MSLRTPLAKARGLGSAKEGLHHWLAQRVSAVALLLLSVWFITALLSASSQNKDIIDLVSSPLHAAGLLLFLGAALYHGTLGVQVVIEDYIHCECVKTGLLMVVKFIAIVTAVAAMLAVITFHVNAKDGCGAKSKSYAAYDNCICDEEKARGGDGMIPCHDKAGMKKEKYKRRVKEQVSSDVGSGVDTKEQAE
jgi:succinate dehydrogenase / fumarate reductase membrane anchor subunit